MKQSYLLVLAILVLFIVGFFVWKGSNQAGQSNQNIRTNAKTLPKEVLITLDKNGFSPKELTIKKGTAVRWKNVSGKPQTINSDNYPTNQLHRELNLGVFNNGSSVIYTFTKPGTYGYHNQFNHSQRGKIIVTG